MLKIDNGENVWFSSDLHYGHRNLVRGTSTWKDKSGCRDFDTVEEHNDTIINNINECIGKDDTLFMLGDWAFGGYDNIWKARERIVCENIIFILGNHDHHIANNRMFENSPDFAFAQEIFSSVHQYLEVYIEGQQMILFHYPITAWNNSFKGSWMLHGHTHDTLTKSVFTQWAGDDVYYRSGKILDIGLDTANRLMGDYEPFNFYDICDMMAAKDIIFNDHHTADTKSP